MSLISDDTRDRGAGHLPWAKLTRSASGCAVQTHSLYDHSIDVAAAFQAIVECAAIRRALDVAAGFPQLPVDIERLCVFALLHDIGKANSGFQGRFWADDASRPFGWPLPCGHGAEGWALITQNGINPRVTALAAVLPLEAISSWGSAAFGLLRASISHHGRPISDAPGGLGKAWDVVENVYDPRDALEGLSALAQALYPEAFTAGEARELSERPAFTHLFGGLIQLADWLGSDTRQGFFPYSEPGERRADTARTRARHAVEAIGLDARDLRSAIENVPLTFTSLFRVPAPRPMQAAMHDSELGRLVVLESETGSGKTEAALWRFFELFKSGAVDSLYFALPTRVSATQILGRVQRTISNAWGFAAPVVVRALPGYEAADGATVQRLPGFQVLWSDHPDDLTAERRWAAESPKRFLAATIAVGTVDQVLLASLRLKHAHLRHAALSRSLIVVDEVHASDAYMSALLQRLLKAHLACGGHALLLSATLGSRARATYFSLEQSSVKPEGLEAALALPYPVITTVSDGVLRTIPVAGNPHHKTVHWEVRDLIDRPDAVASIAYTAALAGARVLVVRNTVPSAIATLQALEALIRPGDPDVLFRLSGVSTLHHSRFSRQDRPALDEAVEVQMGKQRSSAVGRVIIGTQTLEQSLDIDADFLVTDLCPMDVLLQRVGRLHRHQRPSPEAPSDTRPKDFVEPQAIVLTPPGHDLSPLLKRAQHGMGPIRMQGALEGVYVDLRMLEATLRLIKIQPTRTIPADNRALVEQATHAEVLKTIASEGGADWISFGHEVEGTSTAKSNFARMQSLVYDEPYDNLEFPGDEARIATRLGSADRLVEFDPPRMGAFDSYVKSVSLRHHQVPRGLTVDAMPENITELSAGGFEFTLGGAKFSYTRVGLERVRDVGLTSQSQEA